MKAVRNRVIQIQDFLTKLKRTGLFRGGASTSLRICADVSKGDCVREYNTFNADNVVVFQRTVNFCGDTSYCFDANTYTGEN